MKRIIIISFISIAVLSVTAFKVYSQRTPPSATCMVRVAVVREARQIDIEIDGQFNFRDGKDGKVISKLPRLPKAPVRLLDKGVLIGMNVYPNSRIIIQPMRDSSVTINGHRFRGEVLLIRTPQNRITAVNSINVEDYVKGVLYHEVSHHWPMEALKAQAVATRTYAMYSINSLTKDFDVTNDIYSQVYGGRNSERYRTGLAVERTAGKILMYNGNILPAYFHATCAGMTEDASELWGINLAPLKGVPCQFCKDSPHMSWKKNYRLKDMQDSLNKHGYVMGLIKDISVLQRDRSGRISQMKVTGRDGRELLISGKDFREAIGPNDLKSNNFEVQMKGYFVDLIGKGWGHGVGMCQWGAFGMARQQFTFDQILKYYYPGVEITDYHDIKNPSCRINLTSAVLLQPAQ